ADHLAAIPLDAHLGGMTYLNRVPADRGEMVIRNQPWPVARRCVERMRPDAVAADIPQIAMQHLEIGRSLFQQNSTRGVVPARGISRSAVFDVRALDANLLRRDRQDREPRHPAESDARDGDIRSALDQDSVVWGKFRERRGRSG